MKTAVTGAGGFLGWHTRAALREQGHEAHAVPLGQAFDEPTVADLVSGAEHVIHIAGVNRASDDEVRDGNIGFAEQLVAALRRAEEPPAKLTYANSIQAGNGTPYGEGKARARDLLASGCQRLGIDLVDVRLPNLFGEHGRPFYNAVTATFCHLLAQGEEPTPSGDKELTLLHAQNAADLLTGLVPVTQQPDLEERETVSGLLGRLQEIARIYRGGQIPDLASPFARDLFNTYRSYTFPGQAPVALNRHADARGSFFELIRCHGGTGQSSFSTTVPGVTRGDHYHRRKVERFVVLEGRARISLRRLFDDEAIDFDVDGEHPVAVDMPTMWSHNITNTGDMTLFTHFWTNDLFDQNSPDTIPEVV